MEKTAETQVQSGSLEALVVGGRTFRPSSETRLTAADLDKARRELGETEETRVRCLRTLREMLAGDADFTYRKDDAYLLRYLRYRKFDCKEAYKHLRKFYAMREEHPDLFRTPPGPEKLLNTGVGAWLPYADENGNGIYIIKLGKWRMEDVSLRELLRLFILVSDVGTMNPHSQVDGIIDIFDLAGVGIAHVAQFLQPALLRLWLRVMQELYPWRIRRLVFYNCSALHYSAMATLRTFLKKKIADRVTLLRSDLCELHEYVSPSVLPREYGGCLDDGQCYSHLKQRILGNLRYLDYEHSFIGGNRP